MIRISRSLSDILAIVGRGDFEELAGTNEDGIIDAKSQPYQVNADDKSKQDIAKQELAKDVSALANPQGGVILIGFQTSTDPMARGELSIAVTRFPNRS